MGDGVAQAENVRVLANSNYTVRGVAISGGVDSMVLAKLLILSQQTTDNGQQSLSIMCRVDVNLSRKNITIFKNI